jgi:UDP-GlcNAc:undecaprenyl-phosphate/decaprenyl-phosphate GlcNAc-1-phosphate transferase
MEFAGWSYLGIFLGSLFLSLLLTPLALRLALRRQIMDEPGGHKGHTSPVPYLGGTAIVTAFAVAVGIGALVRPPESGRAELLVLLGLAVGLAVVGLIDDLRNLSPWLRLGVQFAAAIGVAITGAGVAITPWEPVNLAATVIWIVGITNAFNLLDNMDGLSAGVASIASAWFFVIAAANGQFLVAGLAIGLAGCALGFLRHNFHPARIYMGDAGSLFLGFMLSVIGLRLRFDAPMEVTFLVPILVLGVAIFDTTLVTVTRLLHRRSPLSGGRDHTSHRLVFIGIPVPATVALIYLGAVSVGWLALVLSQLDRDSGYLLMGWIFVVAAFVGVLLGRTPVYETSRRRRLMIQEVIEHEVEPAPNLSPERHEVPAAPRSAAGTITWHQGS